MRVLSVDPALGGSGWVVLDTSDDLSTITVGPYGVIDATKTVKEYDRTVRKSLDASTLALMKLPALFESLITDHHIEHVCCESPFMHRLPMAFRSLSLVVYQLRLAAFRTIQAPVCGISPQEAKRVMTGRGGAEKHEVQAAVLAHPQIIIPEDIRADLEAQESHVFDAIGVGYTYVHHLRKGTLDRVIKK